jgi:hypothetical protein
VSRTFVRRSRYAGKASRLLQIKDLDERIEVENAATVALARKFNIVAS